MAAASGVKVPTEVTSAWSTASTSSNPPRALVLLIAGESFSLHSTIPASSSYTDDISLLLPSLPTAKTCASFVYRTDDKVGTGYDWVLITYVPDDAGVRQKMLHASSKSGLAKALGEGRIQRSMFFTNVSDLTPKAFSSHLAHIAAPPPLTASEAALVEIKAAEAEEAKRAELTGQYRGLGGFGGGGGAVFGAPAPLGFKRGGGGQAGANESSGGGVSGRGVGAMGMMMSGGAKKEGVKFGSGVEEALKGLLTDEGAETGKAVLMQIDPPTETLNVFFSGAISPSALASKIPPKEPCFTFYAWPRTPSPSTPTTASTPKLPLDSPMKKLSVDPTMIALPATPLEGPAETPAAEEKEETEVAEPEPAKVVEEKKKDDVRVGFIYTCPSASPVRWRMLYSVSVGFVIREAEGKAGVKVEKKLETSDISDLTESYLKTELFPPLPPTKSSSLGTPSSFTPGFRNFGAPMRSSTLPSSGSPGTPSAAADAPTGGDGIGSGGALPDTAFSVFGPRINVGSGGAGGFARPSRPGKR